MRPGSCTPPPRSASPGGRGGAARARVSVPPVQPQRPGAVSPGIRDRQRQLGLIDDQQDPAPSPRAGPDPAASSRAGPDSAASYRLGSDPAANFVRSPSASGRSDSAAAVGCRRRAGSDPDAANRRQPTTTPPTTPTTPRTPATALAEWAARALVESGRCDAGVAPPDADAPLLTHHFTFLSGVEACVSDPAVFFAIRRQLGVTPAEWEESWSSAPQPPTRSAGKSGGSFVASGDGRFLLKTVPAEEAATLRALAPALLGHFDAYPASLINRPCAACRVEVMGQREWFVAFASAFRHPAAPLPARVVEVFDLKGSLHGREAGEHDRRRTPPVLKDVDWLRRAAPLRLRRHDAATLCQQLYADCALLCARELMDYSLLVVVCAGDGADGSYLAGDDGCSYCISVIDYLQKYNTKKRMAHAVKSLAADSSTLSTVPPAEYAARFLAFAEGAVLGLAPSPAAPTGRVSAERQPAPCASPGCPHWVRQGQQWCRAQCRYCGAQNHCLTPRAGGQPHRGGARAARVGAEVEVEMPMAQRA